MLDKIDLNDIKEIALNAGETIMKIYDKDFAVEFKDDKSPLTEADLASNDIIVNALEKFDIPIMSEEGKMIE